MHPPGWFCIIGNKVSYDTKTAAALMINSHPVQRQFTSAMQRALQAIPAWIFIDCSKGQIQQSTEMAGALITVISTASDIPP